LINEANGNIISQSSVNRCWTAVLCDDDDASVQDRSIYFLVGNALSHSDRYSSISTSWSSWWILRRRILAFRLTNIWTQEGSRSRTSSHASWCV